MGPTSSQTLCTQGKISELAVSVLIDSGSSHNIIQPCITEFLGLPVVAIKPFSVFVGNGQTIQCLGNCLDVPITLSGHEFLFLFFLFCLFMVQILCWECIGLRHWVPFFRIIMCLLYNSPTRAPLLLLLGTLPLLCRPLIRSSAGSYLLI